MLRPGVQPGSDPGYTLPPEVVTLTFAGSGPIVVESPAEFAASEPGPDGGLRALLTVEPVADDWTATWPGAAVWCSSTMRWTGTITRMRWPIGSDRPGLAGAPRPLFRTREQGAGRVFVSIPGHDTWTFDDPLFRVVLLRGMAWAVGEPVDRFDALVTPGARVVE